MASSCGSSSRKSRIDAAFEPTRRVVQISSEAAADDCTLRAGVRPVLMDLPLLPARCPMLRIDRLSLPVLTAFLALSGAACGLPTLDNLFTETGPGTAGSSDGGAGTGGSTGGGVTTA